MTRGIETDEFVNRLEEQRQIANRLGNTKLKDIASVCSWGDFLGRPLVTPMDRRINRLKLDLLLTIKQ